MGGEGGGKKRIKDEIMLILILFLMVITMRLV